MEDVHYYDADEANMLLQDLPSPLSETDLSLQQMSAEAGKDDMRTVMLEEADRAAERSREKRRAKEKERTEARNERIAGGEVFDKSKPSVQAAASRYNMSVPVTKEQEQERLMAGMSPAVSDLFKSLGVNLGLQMSKKDLGGLVKVLLASNRTELEALQRHPRVPLSIKNIINRYLKDDLQGETELTERLIRSVYGSTLRSNEEVADEKRALAAAVQETKRPQTTLNILSVIPGMDGVSNPFSREGYAMVREKIFGKQTPSVEDTDAEEIDDILL
jgi:hypothetical protein